MLRKLYLFCLTVLMASIATSSYAQRGKSEVSFGYGYYSFYSFVNHGMNDAPYSTSSGTGVLTYRYYLTRTVTVGLGFGLENISSWGSFFTVAPELTVAYLDTRNDHVRVRLYGSVSAGISALTDNVIGYGEADESGAKPWAFQLTPIGMRVGRQFAGFVELGLGYKGLVNAGIALRVPRVLHHREKVD